MRILLTLLVSTTIITGLSAQEKIGDSPSTYWIQFADKSGTPHRTDSPLTFLSQRAIDRREKYGIPITNYDLPVSPAYLDSLRAIGWDVLFSSRWFNGAVCSTPSATLDDEYLVLTGKLTFVLDSTYTDSLHHAATPYARPSAEIPIVELDTTSGDYYDYTLSKHQTAMHKGQYLHNNGYRGQGMHIAIIDGGFYNFDKISAFDHLRNEGRLLGARDFADPDTNIYRILNTGGYHGTWVASLMAGLEEGSFVGTAPEASYWLLRSENDAYEQRAEEYFWLAAAEFADSAGVDIINASLGYSNHFDDDDKDYHYSDMDGQTSVITLAAEALSSRGVLVVCGAGNEGYTTWHYIMSPADAENVLAVGGVDRYGEWASFSSTGPTYDGRVKPDVVAMGIQLYLLDTEGNASSMYFGTSFASPIMCGLAACYWQARPELSNLQVIEALRMAGDEYYNENRNYLRGYGIPDMVEAIYYPTGDSTVSVSSLMDAHEIQLYPTPFSDKLYIHLPEGNYHLSISDMSGRCLIKQQLAGNGGRQRISGCAQLKRGIYLLTVQNQEGVVSRKIIKQ